MIVSLLVGLSLFNVEDKPLVTFPIEVAGEAYVGKFFITTETPKDTIFNIDVGIQASMDVIDVAGHRFFIAYRDELYSGVQEGNVTFDPREAHYYLIGGFRFNVMDKVAASLFINHDCNHNIDRRYDSLKVVFNRITLSLGTPGAYTNNNLSKITTGQWYERLNGKITYEWFPHDTVIDALNSTDIYHAFRVEAIFDQPVYRYIYASARISTYLSRIKPKPDDPEAYEPFWGFEFAPQIGIGVVRERSALELYLKSWLVADIGDIGFREPNPWPYLVLNLRF
ncbi:hypothetical protein JXM67_15300 [candidate division WOR-3 bacterium]|nr:hypothetical protein [candidate division WOR-3 bacterium]